MLRYILRRLGFSLFVLFAVTTMTFFLAYVVPGDPARMVAGETASTEQVEQVRKQLNLDKPVTVQYWSYLNRLLQGDLGVALHSNRPVVQDIREFFAATFELTTIAMIICLAVGVPLGVLSAVRKDTWIDHGVRLFSLSGVSMPSFWLGLLVQMLFGMAMKALPIAGRVDSLLFRRNPFPRVTGLYLVDTALAGNWVMFRDAASHLVLPALCLAYPSLVMVTRMVRASLLEVMQEDYVRTARAFGLGEEVVVYKYALRNALLPAITIMGLAYGYLLGGSFLVETIFAWPGLGRYASFSIINSDYPAIMGVTILVAIVYTSVNLVVDLLYAYVDPRVRLS